MLDSNTDQMWFVIGAVIVVGAFVMITHMMFGEEIEESLQMAEVEETAVVEDTGSADINVAESELYAAYSGINLARQTEGYLTSGGDDVQEYYPVDMQALSQMRGETLTASFQLRNPEGTGGYARHVLTSEANGGVYVGTRSEVIPLSEDWTYHTHTFVLTDELFDAMMSAGESPVEAGLKSNAYVDGNNGERYPVSVMEYQLELGETASPYHP